MSVGTTDAYELPVPGVCPHCKSLDIDPGATGLDECNSCGGLSRNGRSLRAEPELADSEARNSAVEIIAGWLARRPNASGRYAHGYRRDAEELVERLRSSQIGFHYHGQTGS